VAAGPAAALAVLRQARMTADAADAAVLAPAFRPVGGGDTATWLRNLLVYGPFAAVVLLVQVALLAVADDAVPGAYAALCGLSMPAAAFGLGWLVLGFAFPAGPGGRVERTPLLGAVVCFAPLVITCVGAGALALVR
ncbi:MAG TPA: hypothetical protein VES42_17760, partial [Pilimelia sp.]|nr:hypothetical protein [Pilimelia sp.]